MKLLITTSAGTVELPLPFSEIKWIGMSEEARDACLAELLSRNIQIDTTTDKGISIGNALVQIGETDQHYLGSGQTHRTPDAASPANEMLFEIVHSMLGKLIGTSNVRKVLIGEQINAWCHECVFNSGQTDLSREVFIEYVTELWERGLVEPGCNSTWTPTPRGIQLCLKMQAQRKEEE